jgi:TolA-binding protein
LPSRDVVATVGAIMNANRPRQLLNVAIAPWLLLVAILTGCLTQTAQQKAAVVEQHAASAKTLFDNTTKLYHLPSAEATGAAKEKLLQQAAAGYEQLLKQFPDQPAWCAKALRSLGNVRATQGQFNEAVMMYKAVAVRYPHNDWEVLQAWKSAGDLLWDANRHDEAKTFYDKIVKRFDIPDQPPVVKTVVRGAKARL